ncbi:IS3 family transposase [Alkalihalobacterium alkalinitrilicum]|uniref:IS3 family transposase n=1 Tax=Alkalihalobacterium alkalinitrilicum TaxID=427920 RepID=UPI0023688752|nr:IS3 family transposase [Alkalihalobacterium alkalinitrilicum]
MPKGKRYDEEFKKDTVKYVLENHKSVAQVAREMDLNENTLYNWVKKYSHQPEIKAAQTFATPDAEVKDLQKQLRDLKEENEILKKGDALLREKPSVKYEFIHKKRSQFRVEKMCTVLGVSKSGYFKWLSRPKSDCQNKHEKLKKLILRTHIEFKQRYGSVKITKTLKKRGVKVSERTVSRIMTANNWKSCTVKKYKATTNSKHKHPVSENILNRKFQVDQPNRFWVTDITYISTNEGWLYLASVMDLYSRKIVGWAMDKTMTKELVINALKMAYKRQRPKPGLIHHSDRGAQYASSEYQKLLNKYKMVGSMSRKGNCYDNACIESFHGILKRELVYQTKFRTRSKARKSILEYVEFFYNSKRIHSTLDYHTPIEFEKKYHLIAA